MPDRHTPLPYRRDIDGLRAVAVAAVVVFHAFPAVLRGGFTGVDVFFVISGYLISSLIWRGLSRGDFRLREFYGRRVLRLFPALVIVLVFCLAAGWWLLLPRTYETLGKDAAAAAAYISNFVFWRESGYFAPAASERPLTHLWSLAVEEQFYLLYPMLLLAAYRHRRATGVLIAALMAASFAWNVATVGNHRTAAFYLLPSRFWELLLGGALAYAEARGLRRTPDPRRRSPLAPRLRDALSLAGLALLPVAFLVPHPGGAFPGWQALAPTAAAALLIGAGPGALVNRLLLARSPMVLVGLFSYPLYLWHFPLLVLARARWGTLAPAVTAAVVAVSVAAAWATYALVERPLRHRVRRVSWRPVPALTALLVATGAGGVAVAASGGVPGRVPFPVQRLATFTYDYATAYREGTCFLKPDQGPSAFTAACVESSGRPLVLLWGDSHAAHLYPGLRSLERSHRFRLAEYTASSCPPFVSYASSDRPECAGVNTAVLARIRQLHPARVVLSAAWEQYPSVEPLVGTVAALRAAGVRSIVVVGPVPKWQDGLPQALFASYRRTHVVPRRMSFALMSSPVQANEQLKRLVPRLGVPYVDALALLCDAHGCITRTGDDLADVTVWDGSHFTDSGSRLFARLAAPALVGRLR